MKANHYVGLVGLLECKVNRMLDWIAGVDDCPYSDAEINLMIGGGYTAACGLNLIGMMDDESLRNIGIACVDALHDIGAHIGLG